MSREVISVEVLRSQAREDDASHRLSDARRQSGKPVPPPLICPASVRLPVEYSHNRGRRGPGQRSQSLVGTVPRVATGSDGPGLFTS